MAMKLTFMRTVAFLFAAMLLFSCAKKEEKAEKPETKEEKKYISDISEEVSLGIFFDEEFTQRKITIGGDRKEFKAYIVLSFPDYMEVGGVEYRLSMPEGLVLAGDMPHPKRTAALGIIDHGISEAIPCESGPNLLLHTLTFSVEGEIKNGQLALLPHETSGFIGIAKCDEGYTKVRAVSYRAVVNPEE